MASARTGVGATGSEDGEILVWNRKIQMSLRAPAPPHRLAHPWPSTERDAGLDQRVQIWEVGTGDYVTLETGARVNDISSTRWGLLAVAAGQPQLWDLDCPDLERPGRQSCRPEGPHQ